MSTPQRQEAYRPTRRELANAIRVLCMDAVERAKSGHPGAPMGMADIAERSLAACFNRPDHEIVDHYTYVSIGDGCLMEGDSHEASSLAGTLGLGKLIAIYDANGISIDGRIEGWFTDDVAGRFAAYRWHVVPAIDGHDPAAITKAIDCGTGRHRPPEPGRLQNRDRLARTHQGRHREGAPRLRSGERRSTKRVCCSAGPTRSSSHFGFTVEDIVRTLRAWLGE